MSTLRHQIWCLHGGKENGWVSAGWTGQSGSFYGKEMLVNALGEAKCSTPSLRCFPSENTLSPCLIDSGFVSSFQTISLCLPDRLFIIWSRPFKLSVFVCLIVNGWVSSFQTLSLCLPDRWWLGLHLSNSQSLSVWSFMVESRPFKLSVFVYLIVDSLVSSFQSSSSTATFCCTRSFCP